MDPCERGEIGPDVFRLQHGPREIDLETPRPSVSGRFKHYIKIKNRQHPAMNRVMEALS